MVIALRNATASGFQSAGACSERKETHTCSLRCEEGSQAWCEEQSDKTVHVTIGDESFNLGVISVTESAEVGFSTLKQPEPPEGKRRVMLTFISRASQCPVFINFLENGRPSASLATVILHRGQAELMRSFTGHRFQITADRSESFAGQDELCASSRNHILKADQFSRSRDYKAAFVALDKARAASNCVYATLDNTLRLGNNSHAGFSAQKLWNEAQQWRHLVEQSKLDVRPWVQNAEVLERVVRQLQSSRMDKDLYALQSLERGPLQALIAAEDRKLIRELINSCTVAGSEAPSFSGRRVLASVNATRVRHEFWTQGVAVLDQVLTDEALMELRRYLLEEACYGRVRPNYVEASPPTFQSVIVRRLAEDLEMAFPDIFKHSTFKRWWAFKQVDLNGTKQGVATDGVILHSDEAMTSFNLWVTPDDACEHGGGLNIWRVMPGEATKFAKYNNMQWQEKERHAVMKHEKVAVNYRANRAVLFMSELFHETQPYVFKSGYTNGRLNVAMLWGTKQKPGTLFNLRPTEFTNASWIPEVDIQ